MPGSHMARTPEERSEAFAGFPERILELREQRSSGTLSTQGRMSYGCSRRSLLARRLTFCLRAEVAYRFFLPVAEGCGRERRSIRSVLQRYRAPIATATRCPRLPLQLWQTDPS